MTSSSTPVKKPSSPYASQTGQAQQIHEMQTGYPPGGVNGIPGSLHHMQPGPSIIQPIQQQPVFSSPMATNQAFVQNQGSQYVQTSYMPGSTVDQTPMSSQLAGHDGSYIGHNFIGAK